MREAMVLFAAAGLAFASGPEFVTVPAGEFTIGCEPVSSCPDWQEPQLIRFDKPFQIAATETTVEQFREFIRTSGYRTAAELRGDQWTWSRPRSWKLHNRQPVVYVNAKDAEAYCASVGARLPSEAEWSYAFRAGETVQGRLWFNTDGRYVWFRENSGYKPQPVAARLPNAWGLFDMEGNAWEWTRSSASGGLPYYIRGGSWITCPRIEGKPGSGSGPFTRCGSTGEHLRDDIGFRCARHGNGEERK